LPAGDPERDEGEAGTINYQEGSYREGGDRGGNLLIFGKERERKVWETVSTQKTKKEGSGVVATLSGKKFFV